MKKIDALPLGPEFSCETVTIPGDLVDESGAPLTEEVDLWLRDPLECIRDLLANPAFRDHLVYRPAEAYTSMQRQCRVFSEMWTGKWWYKLQVCQIAFAFAYPF